MDSYNTPVSVQPDDFPSLHPVLRPMRRTCERLFEAGDFERAFPILGALSMLNGEPSFFRGSAHFHFPDDLSGKIRRVCELAEQRLTAGAQPGDADVLRSFVAMADSYLSWRDSISDDQPCPHGYARLLLSIHGLLPQAQYITTGSWGRE